MPANGTNTRRRTQPNGRTTQVGHQRAAPTATEDPRGPEQGPRRRRLLRRGRPPSGRRRPGRRRAHGRDRVNEIVEPLTTRQTAERELKSIRTQVERELNRLERRGATARRKATHPRPPTRNRVERELNQRRRQVETHA